MFSESYYSWCMVIKKDKLLILNFILILSLNDKFVTVHNKCSKIPPPTSTYLATPVQRSDSNSSISVTNQY